MTSTKQAGDTPASPAPTETNNAGASSEAPVSHPATETTTTTVATKVEGVPEKYDLKLPDDAVIDAASLERIAATARARGLSNEQAQALVEVANSEAASFADAAIASHQPGGAEWVKQEQAWRTAAEKDPEIGGSPEKLAQSLGLAKRVLAQYGDASTAEFLEKSGLGSNPAVLRMLVKIGKASSESPVVLSQNQTAGPKDPRSFYPNSPELNP